MQGPFPMLHRRNQPPHQPHRPSKNLHRRSKITNKLCALCGSFASLRGVFSRRPTRRQRQIGVIDILDNLPRPVRLLLADREPFALLPQDFLGRRVGRRADIRALRVTRVRSRDFKTPISLSANSPKPSSRFYRSPAPAPAVSPCPALAPVACSSRRTA
jgi:hypothetical protein